MSPKLPAVLDEALASLRDELKDNLYSCCVYGSVVRGNAIEGVSDVNLLIVLNESNTGAHRGIAQALGQWPQIDPFILGRRGFDRSTRVFAPKFASIRRHYRVLHGADPLAAFQPDPQQERFLCEQAVRNLRLRMVYAFVTGQQNKAYDRFLVRNATAFILHFSQALRLNGVVLPAEFEARIPVLEEEFKIDGRALRDLLALKRSPRRLSESETVAWHERLFPVVDSVLVWIESAWPA